MRSSSEGFDSWAIGLLREGWNHPWARCALAVIAVEAALLLLAIAVQQRLMDWDAWAIWGIKAKAFFIDGSIDPYLERAGVYGFSWPARPCFSAILQAVVYTCMGRVDETAARLAHWCWYVSVLMLACHLLRQAFEWRRALGWTAVMSVVPVLTYHATAGLSTMVLGCYLFAAFVALGRWVRQPRLPLLFGVAGLLGCVWLIRDEGMALGVLGIVAVFLVMAASVSWWRRVRMAAMLVLIAGAIYGLWARVLSAHDVWDLRSSWDWSDLLPHIAGHLRDLPLIIRFVLEELATPEAQTLATPLERLLGVALFWPIALWGSVRCLWGRMTPPVGRGCAWLTLAGLCMYIGGFLAFPYTDVVEMGQNWISSLDRHMVSLIPFAVCALACAVEGRAAPEHALSGNHDAVMLETIGEARS